MRKYVVQYVTDESGHLEDREVVVVAASAAEAMHLVSGHGEHRHAHYAELTEG